MQDEYSLSRLDLAFATFLSERSLLDMPARPPFLALIARLSAEQRQGHSCILLANEEQKLCLASGLCLATELQGLAESATSSTLPLVLAQNRLYLYRYWHYEYRLAKQLKAKAGKHYQVANLESVLERYFPLLPNSIDWQRQAAYTALQNALCIITGGPGTGKTTTVVKILALLQEVAAKPLHIALAAPTGKAAMRLQESIGQRKNELPCAAEIKQAIPGTVSTIHRLLGARAASVYFKHDAQQPLAYDVVVVDEASMIDLALMSKLVDALKPDARLILLGDQEQLASVESGAVLANLTTALTAQTVELKTTHRFNTEIGALATAVNQQQATQAWELLQQPSAIIARLTSDPIAYIAEQQRPYLQLIQAGADYAEVYAAFMQFQALCSNRQGSHSVNEVNHQVERHLASDGLINIRQTWYSGRPVIITENNQQLHLYNGDIGICMPDPEQGGKLRVFFQLADGRVKKFLPARIASCDTVFAMTIHKSQGSEFKEVLVLLPDTLNPVLTKELLYTAITRAKQIVKIVANKEVFHATIKQRVTRVTGLVAMLDAL